MKKLQLYSFRILLLSTVLELLVSFRESGIFPYVPLLLCFTAWIIIENIIVRVSFEGEIGILSLYTEALLILSLMIMLRTYLGGLFMGFLIFKILYFKVKGNKLIHIGTILFLYLIGIALSVFLLKEGRMMYEKFIALVPSLGIGFLAFSVIKTTEQEMTNEIDAQQKQIDGKNKLLSTLSHELRTPLAVIKTSSEILLEERPGGINSTQRRFLKSIQDNTTRMSRFIDSILASIKVEYAWFRMKKKERDIRSIIKKVCNDLEPFIQSRHQTIKYTYPNLLSKTIIDENWIQQVLINLIHNASKHVGKRGRIVISVNENEQCVVVSVSDDGSGIDNEDKPKVFSEFYQGKDVDGTAEDNFNGVGLGLSIVKNVIEKHGGNVYMGSVSGMGTTLSFTIPKVEE